jgi:uncharacterized membrane protein
MHVNSVTRGSVLQVFCTLCVISSTAWRDEVPRRVLVIQEAGSHWGSEFLADSLRKHQLSVDVQSSNRLFSSLNELKPYSSVILFDVPRDGEEGSHFTDEQIRLLMHNTHEEGRGLVLIGGPNSFGSGGWANTQLEDASPVQFNPAPLDLSGGLVLVVDDWQAPASTHLQRLAAREAMKPLGPKDRFDLVYSDGTAKWLDGEEDGMPRLGDRRANLLQRVDRMSPGEIASFDETLGMVIRCFETTAATVKHVVILSDGSPKPPSDRTIQMLQQNRVRVSTIAMATAGSDTLQRIAARTGGRYYVTKRFDVLPHLCRREARFVLRPHVFDPPDVLQVKIVTPHAITAGVGDKLPPIGGLTLTTTKKNDDVELVLTASTTKHDFPLLALREYGKGRIAALTTDAGTRWARSWTSREHRDTTGKLLYRLTLWSAGVTELQD